MRIKKSDDGVIRKGKRGWYEVREGEYRKWLSKKYYGFGIEDYEEEMSCPVFSDN